MPRRGVQLTQAKRREGQRNRSRPQTRLSECVQLRKMRGNKTGDPTSMTAHHSRSHLAADAPMRAALYMRVSTGRQAEHDLSIPDQQRQLKSWCRENGYEVVAEYVEAGASAADDRRPSFQRMIERACDGGNAFDIIVVHSYSRFFRE